MSIIQDALKKAQEERRKINGREVPYHLSGIQKKSKTAIMYVVGGLCVAAVFAYLYIPYLHKPKQIAQPVVVQPPVPAKPAQAAVIEKPVVSVTPNDKQGATGTKTGIAPVQKTAISSPVKRKTRAVESVGTQDAMSGPVWAVESVGTQDAMSGPVRVVEKKTDNASNDNMYNEALREQQSGRTREAKTIYKQILTKQPSHIEALNNLGVIAIQEGNTQEALFYFKRILEYRNNYPKAYNNIGLIAMKDGDRQLAEEYLRKAISLEPDDPGPYVNLSVLLRSQGRLQEAAKLLEIPIQKKAKDPDLLLSYAVIKDNLGQYEDAARYYRQYLSSIQTPALRKDIIDRLQYIEGKR
jgi:Flp pilus assembly protein TadD